MKLGQLIPCEHVVCLAHTLHLVVADVHYEKLLPLVTAIEDPYSEEDEENHADDVAPDLTLPQEQPIIGKCFITYTLPADHRRGHSTRRESQC